MNILLIGQCTLHWGRMEFGNIGNYYIIEPFIRQLHEVFPKSLIRTTFQMSHDFCRKEELEVLPMEYYYGWNKGDLPNAYKELKLAEGYQKNGFIEETTPFIDEVLWSDLVIDFSGDIWGKNADFLGSNRFLVGLYKDRVAQKLGKKTVMLAGSPGPFKEGETLEFAKEVYKSFDLVTNREPVSTAVLENYGFDTSNTQSLACPAFLFEPIKKSHLNFEEIRKISKSQKPVVGFTICGWNFLTGPFDKWPIAEKEYDVFVEALESFVLTRDVTICLFSHSNGFHIPPEPFELIHGRDYPIIKQLQSIIQKRSKIKDLMVLDNVYSAWETKEILSNFDMIISGRVHAAVGGISQNIPTVIIDYGHEPKAHKLKGFAIVSGALEYLADPASEMDLLLKMEQCWENREKYKENLKEQMPLVKQKAEENFVALKKLFN